VSDYLNDLRFELVTASERLSQRSAPVPSPRRWWRRSPRALTVALAALAVSATALAATAPWEPLFGDAGSPQPRITGAAPPADQLALLGVLRRSQTDQDRGGITRQALRFFGTSTQDIYTNYIRRLPRSDGGLPAVLLPARSWQIPNFITKDNVVCLFVAEPHASGGAKGCYTTAEIERGWAGGSLGSIAYALVPDGVSRVRIRYATGIEDIAVHGNFYEFRAPAKTVRGGGRVPVRSMGTSWLDANGDATPQQPRRH
jgi:hypothetical protein